MQKTTLIICLLAAYAFGYIFGRQDQSMKDYEVCEAKIEQAVQTAQDLVCEARIEDVLAQF